MVNLPATKAFYGISQSRKSEVPRQSMTTEESVELITILHRQDQAYKCEDYLAFSRFDDSNDDDELAAEHDVDANCREKMIEWCYRVCDCGIFPCDREVVAIAISYLDRYMMKIRQACNRSTFKLAAVTKIMCCMQIRIDHLVDLGRGSFDGDDVLQMEHLLLEKLEWRMNPPTVQCFIRNLWTLIPVLLRKESIYYRSIFFAELAVYEYECITKDRYTIAVACLFNALESHPNNLVIAETEKVRNHIATLSNNVVGQGGLQRIRSRLWNAYSCSAHLADEKVHRPCHLIPSRHVEPLLQSCHSPISALDDDDV
jgi:Cyclin, N-terminal domain